jgi:hypothetical protein
MRKSTVLFTFALALGAVFHTPGAGANEPTKITECGTIVRPGSYVLTKNLTAAGDCLVVNADFVSIDLAGFLITGDGTGAGIRADPVGPESAQGIAVRNGTIAGFEFGVAMIAIGSIVEGVRAVGNSSTGIFTSGIVRNNTAVGNRIHGIIATGTVSGNIAEDNDQNGIFGAGTVSGNTARRNRGGGIGAGGGSTVSGNTAEGNGQGISVSCPSNVIGNTATNNAGGNLVLGGEGCNNIDNLAP